MADDAPHRKDDDLDGCELDFKHGPTSDGQAKMLLYPTSRDRTEAEEDKRRKKARQHAV